MEINQAPVKHPPTHHLLHYHHQRHLLQQVIVGAVAVTAAFRHIATNEGIHLVIVWVIQMARMHLEPVVRVVIVGVIVMDILQVHYQVSAHQIPEKKIGSIKTLE